MTRFFKILYAVDSPLKSRAGLGFLMVGLVWLAAFGGGPGEALAQPADEANVVSRPLTDLLSPFIGIPFREDGAADSKGRWVTFNNPEVLASTPGFNCSGFTVAAARVLLGQDFDLATVALDRRGDSGADSPLGRDWDFGLDLILNLSQGQNCRFLPEPENSQDQPLVPLGGGRSLGWGVSLHSPEFEKLLQDVRLGHFYFFVLSKPDRRFAAGVAYYHVGVIVPDSEGLWLYHTTLGARTHRINLAKAEDLARFRRDFKPVSVGERRILLVEVQPPLVENSPGPGLAPAAN